MRAWLFVILLAGMALPALAQSPPPREENPQPSRMILTFMTGKLSLANGSQTLYNSDWTYDRSATKVLAIEGESRLPGRAGNFSIGGQYLHYENAFRRTSGVPPDSGTMDSHAFLAKARYYFAREQALQPYAGLGLGLAYTEDYTGPLNGVSNGQAYLGVVGLLLRSERVGLRVEYTALRARVSDQNGQKLDTSTQGVVAGISFFLGRK